MGETLDYLNAMQRLGLFDGEFFTDCDPPWFFDDEDGRPWCDGDMVRVKGSPRDNKRYRCLDCGAIRQKRRPHLIRPSDKR